jgi:hypothetical protein
MLGGEDCIARPSEEGSCRPSTRAPTLTPPTTASTAGTWNFNIAKQTTWEELLAAGEEGQRCEYWEYVDGFA